MPLSFFLESLLRYLVISLSRNFEIFHLSSFIHAHR